MKRFIKSDYFLMFVSVFVAILLWIFVVYEQNPMHETWLRDVPIVYTNQAADFENGKLIVLDGDIPKVDLKIRGRRSVISTVNASSVTCSVNMGEISEAGSYTLPVTFNTAVYGVELMQKKPNSVSLVVDNVVTEEREITLINTGEVAEGYVAGETECSPAIIKLTGPSSAIQNVKSASVNVDFTGASQDIANLYKIKLYDSENREIADGRISKNIEYCDIKCPVYKTKKVAVVPILRSETNSRGQAVSVSAVTPAEVTVMGSAELVDKIEEIYTNDIDTYNIVETTKVTAKLDVDSVEDGVTIMDDITEVEIELSPESDEEPQTDEQNQNSDEQQNNNGGNE